MPVEQSLRREKKNPLLFSAQVSLSLSVGLIAAYFFTGRWNVVWVLLLAGTVLWCSDKILVSGKGVPSSCLLYSALLWLLPQ